jgi:hypothetical protein
MERRRKHPGHATGVPWPTLVAGGAPLVIALGLLSRLRGRRRLVQAEGEASKISAMGALEEFLIVRLAVGGGDRVALILQVRSVGAASSRMQA